MKTFELCKKLHDLKPDWQGITDCKYLIKFKAPKSHIYPEDVNQPCYDWAPEYTLEYLLNKLPSTIKDGSGVFALVGGQGQHGDDWTAFYMDEEGYVMDSSLNCNAQTPLNAVLKLAIAVVEAKVRGELGV